MILERCAGSRSDLGPSCGRAALSSVPLRGLPWWPRRAGRRRRSAEEPWQQPGPVTPWPPRAGLLKGARAAQSTPGLHNQVSTDSNHFGSVSVESVQARVAAKLWPLSEAGLVR